MAGLDTELRERASRGMGNAIVAGLEVLKEKHGLTDEAELDFRKAFQKSLEDDLGGISLD